MRNIRVITDELNRSQLANPFPKGSIKDRLVKRKSVNKINNFTTVDFGNLYGKTVSIDKNKTF
ncbi:hypothetical protein [Neobacillus muris]|uniref:hypothetical protein n=1 Tax=Neobacillus muris TaxID=2941334 RepID=UPI00203AD108|nr:hypothetical protein [Neobacillus muris]